MSTFIPFYRNLTDPRLSELDSTELNSEIDKIEFEHVSFKPHMFTNLTNMYSRTCYIRHLKSFSQKCRKRQGVSQYRSFIMYAMASVSGKIVV